MVPRKLYRAFDSSSKATLALKLVESYGFEAACSWAEHHLAVPSMVVRYVLHDAMDDAMQFVTLIALTISGCCLMSVL